MAKVYHYYMQRIDGSVNTVIDLENHSDFIGLKYLKTTGMFDIGESKNIYTEDYAESDRLRVMLPNNDVYVNKATKITMTFIIIGTAADRELTLRNFSTYVRTGIHRYWDDARNREFDFIVVDEITVSDERWHGSQPYVEIQIPMQNLNGKTQVHQTN